jgi:uncharacterized protein YecE (DUF72 family)
MRIWIGTSGYSYPDWVGGFYPLGMRTDRMLAHYVHHFPLVELNFTFYRPPTAEMLGRMAQQVPAGFQFLMKMPRALSHENDPRELPGFRRAAEELQRRGQLMSLLCQLPQATHNEKQHRAWLETLSQELAGLPLAVEFRHHSWSQPDVPPWLAEHHYELVSVDAPSIPSLYPSGLVQSGPGVYVRFHSRIAYNWYKSDKDRYDYHYDDAALAEWIGDVRGAAAATDRVMLLFNNCQRSHAAENAQRMRELFATLAPELEVVAPFAAPAPTSSQRLLFDN